jgi:ABC-type dipeptide/oligopeptide/nickel transport system permease subunit
MNRRKAFTFAALGTIPTVVLLMCPVSAFGNTILDVLLKVIIGAALGSIAGALTDSKVFPVVTGLLFAYFYFPVLYVAMAFLGGFPDNYNPEQNQLIFVTATAFTSVISLIPAALEWVLRRVFGRKVLG